jgi:hypothetical protein
VKHVNIKMEILAENGWQELDIVKVESTVAAITALFAEVYAAVDANATIVSELLLKIGRLRIEKDMNGAYKAYRLTIL